MAEPKMNKSFQISMELNDRLARFANETGKSQVDIVEEALTIYLNESQVVHKETKKSGDGNHR